MSNNINITADAVDLQERDEFRADGWTKVVSPAKVNLHLSIGRRREDGYHDAATVMHALNLHDVVYLRLCNGEEYGSGISCRLVPANDIVLPPIPTESNLAVKAVVQLAEALGAPGHEEGMEIRIEKSIPAQAGLGGGSSNAAAALVGAAALWGVDADHPAVEATARALGADVAFFLHGGCAYLEGTGDTFSHSLTPLKQAVALVKPEGGVSTAQAYRQFDADPHYIDAEHAAQVKTARAAENVRPYNNLSEASESLMPELARVRQWLCSRPQVEDALLCGSGAATFALCRDFDSACAVVAAAREQGWWARSTSLGSIRAAIVSGGVAGKPITSAPGRNRFSEPEGGTA